MANTIIKLIIVRRIWYLFIYKKLQKIFYFNQNRNSNSNIPIDILIPATEKDLATLPCTIKSVRLYIKHPITTIYVIAPDSEKIKSVCSKEKCRYLNEDAILPITKKDIDYKVKDIDRSGWLFQQLLKLSGDKICTQEYFLVIDADTVLLKPHTFLIKNKTLFMYSDEYHLPYFKMYKKIVGVEANSCVSFVSHQMLFHKPKLYALKKKIEENTQSSWYSAIINNIDKNETSGFSEYETYGNFVLSNYPQNIKREYFFNISLNSKKIVELDRIAINLSKKYRSVSFHSYNR
ncbi:DUF6492 family protein [Methanosarcina vacuolata]|uniref:Nucleotide-diphospho-sugar transferase domain-containing protein n=1 Tax=Methanosarcina vacuolata Z-761 TaxID=1434123 RepID=A0A0E3Q7Z8_9EURY|nr:DUF6492 family protein [Methanosarcina vacuolata]AKB45107.1 hypothetical protein MSVAZ_2838 [Methanosarcina vacuolata Z-761]